MRRPIRLLAAAVLLTAVATAAVAANATDDARPGTTTTQLLAYEKALLPVAKDWGSIEILGMRPAVADLQTGGALGRPEVVATQARAWRAALVADRTKLQALQPPEEVRAAGPLLDRAIALYIDAASSFLAATGETGVRRTALVDEGIAQARRGAALYNDASAVLQHARRAHGLPPTPDLPDRS